MKKLITRGEVFFWCVMAAFAACGSGCGSTKTAVKSDVHVNQVTITKADSTDHKVSNVKTFGDSLFVTNYIPFSFWKPDTAKGETVTKKDTLTFITESHGIKHKQSFTPIYDHSEIIGLAENDTTIAKPITTTSTTEDKQSHVSQTAVKDSTAHVKSTTTKTSGFSLPSWLWWTIGIIAGVILIALIITKKFI